MIRWTLELNVNEGKGGGGGVRGTSVSCCLGLNCQPKAEESASLSFSKPTPWGSLSSIKPCGTPLPYKPNGGNNGMIKSGHGDRKYKIKTHLGHDILRFGVWFAHMSLMGSNWCVQTKEQLLYSRRRTWLHW